jgi:Family of unknown function (DUF5684)
MKRLMGRVGAAFCFCMVLASAGYGKQLKSVYLKDGGIIDCRSFWKEDGKVMVLVNRDVLVDFPQNEVDLKRTFKARKRIVAAHQGPAVQTTVPGKQTTVGEKEQGGAPPTASGKQAAALPASKPASPGAAKEPALGPHGAEHASPGPKPGASPPVAAPVPRPAPKLHVPPPNAASPSPIASVAAGMLGIGTLLPFLLIIVLLIASFWRIFTKAGEAGWQAIIPLYNLFILVKISGKPWWWFLLLFVPLVNIIIGILVQIALADRFDRGVLYGLGLAFLGFIFYPLLAFSDATYRQSAY